MRRRSASNAKHRHGRPASRHSGAGASSRSAASSVHSGLAGSRSEWSASVPAAARCSASAAAGQRYGRAVRRCVTLPGRGMAPPGGVRGRLGRWCSSRLRELRQAGFLNFDLDLRRLRFMDSNSLTADPRLGRLAAPGRDQLCRHQGFAGRAAHLRDRERGRPAAVSGATAPGASPSALTCPNPAVRLVVARAAVASNAASVYTSPQGVPARGPKSPLPPRRAFTVAWRAARGGQHRRSGRRAGASRSRSRTASRRPLRPCWRPP